MDVGPSDSFKKVLPRDIWQIDFKNNEVEWL